MLPEPPRDEKPQIHGPSQLPVPVMRSRVIGEFQFTLSQYTQHANCSEFTLTVDLLDKNPSTYLGELFWQLTIRGYRVWRNDGHRSQHARILNHIVSPRFSDEGLDGLAVCVFAYGVGKAAMYELRGLQVIDLPNLQIML